jgi:Universal stress protein family
MNCSGVPPPRALPGRGHPRRRPVDALPRTGTGSRRDRRLARIGVSDGDRVRRGVEARGDLIALHACSDAGVLDFPGMDWSTMKSSEDKVLAERLAGWQERFPDVTIRRLVVCDRPGRQLVEHSEEAQPVVVGSRGRGGFAGMCLVRSAWQWFSQHGSRSSSRGQPNSPGPNAAKRTLPRSLLGRIREPDRATRRKQFDTTAAFDENWRNLSRVDTDLRPFPLTRTCIW